MKLEKDTIISHYKIISEIGKGGMGEVYLTQDTELERKVAIKFLSEQFSKDTDKLNRFIQEAKAASALNHPNIITIHEIGKYDHGRYLALEYIDGETLTERLKKKLRFNAALDIATQIASALDAAHASGIVHRDIKPDNVMLRKDGLVKILDFGIAKLTEKRTSDVESEDKTAVQVNTSPGMIIGTANYMSPEQAKGQKVDARTDIFSFGVLLYEMVAGRLPFEGEGPMEVIASIINREPAPLDGMGIPDDLVQIINKTLRKNPDRRYQTIKGLLADLNDVYDELKFQDKLEKTVQPSSADRPDTRVFKGTTAADVHNTTAEGANDSIAFKRSSFNKIAVGGLALLLISLAAIGYWYFSSSSQINSIAVMPFVNESGSEDVEYLSDGMTESLISSLTEIPDLSVKARSTVFIYKGKNKTPKEIGDELGVEAVLLGRLVQRGDNIKLSLELVDTGTLDAIWSQSYDRKMSDLVTLQSEIARNVSDKLRLKLTTAGQEKVAKSDTEDPKARQLYLKGIYHLNKRADRNGAQELAKAAGFFKEAIEQDPNYTIAYTGLADSYTLLPFWGLYRSTEYLPKARQSALKALELNNDLAQAHASMGNILLFEYDWDGAEREYKKAIKLDPKYANAHKWYGDFLATKEMYDEGLQNYDKALELDPFNPSTLFGKYKSLADANRLDEAIELCKKFIELFPEQSRVHFNLSTIYLEKGMERESVEQYWIGMKKYGVNEAEIQSRKDIYKQEGFNGLKRNFLERNLASIKTALEKDKNAVINYYSVARTYAELKDKEKTLEYLNKAYQDRDPKLTDLKRTRDFDFLRDEPQFKELVKKIGFPE